jgi:hypothetical protein
VAHFAAITAHRGVSAGAPCPRLCRGARRPNGVSLRGGPIRASSDPRGRAGPPACGHHRGAQHPGGPTRSKRNEHYPHRDGERRSGWNRAGREPCTPGVTGLTFFSPELTGKRLEILKELVPDASRVAVLWNPDGPAKVEEFKATAAAATALGLHLQSLEVRAPDPDFKASFAAATKGRAAAILTLGNPLTLRYSAKIADLARGHRLPSMFDSRQFVDAGGLASYGPAFDDLYRRAAVYVDRILKGAKPADLPVEQPTKFELVVNLRTAKALGLTIPPSVLARADAVIE